MNVRAFYVYMLTSRRNGTLYIGVTSDLAKRVDEHRRNLVAGFTRSHRVHRLVWYEVHESAYGAISREKQLKPWNRTWKVRLIEETNPYWTILRRRACDAEDAGSRPSRGRPTSCVRSDDGG